MTMVNKGHRVLTLFLAIFMMFSLVAPMSVFALGEWDANDTYITVSPGVIKTDTIQNAIKSSNNKNGFGDVDELMVKVEGVPLPVMRVKGDLIEINKSVWNEAREKQVITAFQGVINGLSELGVDEDAVQTLCTNIGNKDANLSAVMLEMSFNNVTANLYKAYRIMEPFIGILNVVLGVGCVLLILILMFSTVMDLAYIGLPVWREAQDSKGKKNPFGVSYEALRTVQEVEKGLGGGDGDYRNAYLLYFKRRALTYIILAICIMYLICGGISGIIGFVLSLVGGITG